MGDARSGAGKREESLKHLVIPNSEEVIKVLRIMSKELRGQLKDATTDQRWNKFHINEDENYDSI